MLTRAGHNRPHCVTAMPIVPRGPSITGSVTQLARDAAYLCGGLFVRRSCDQRGHAAQSAAPLRKPARVSRTSRA
jgi:hypothetical protein